jgi:hypothetical protein
LFRSSASSSGSSVKRSTSSSRSRGGVTRNSCSGRPAAARRHGKVPTPAGGGTAAPEHGSILDVYKRSCPETGEVPSPITNSALHPPIASRARSGAVIARRPPPGSMSGELRRRRRSHDTGNSQGRQGAHDELGRDSVRELIVTDVLVSGLRGQHGDGSARPGPCVLWLAAQAGIWLATAGRRAWRGRSGARARSRAGSRLAPACLARR